MVVMSHLTNGTSQAATTKSEMAAASDSHSPVKRSTVYGSPSATETSTPSFSRKLQPIARSCASALSPGSSGGAARASLDVTVVRTVAPSAVLCFFDVFEIMDVDGDGEISASDLQMHILKFGDTFVSDHEAALMLNALRSNGPVEFGAFEKFCVA